MNVSRNLFRILTPAALWRGIFLACLLSQPAFNLAHAAGTVVAWGANDSLQCQVPPNLTNVIAVSGGVSHSLALKGDGTVAAWGDNLFGEATVPANLTNVISVSAGSSYSLALLQSGTVVSWGNRTAVPAYVTNVVAIAAGWTHSLALKANGTVVSWGSLTNVPANLTNVAAIAAGNGQSLALKADGTLLAWGDNSFGKTNVPAGLTNITAIAAGADHCLALSRIGTVVGWGRNNDGQINVPGSLTFAVAIGAGALHSVALKPDGSLVAWGDNTYQQTNVNTSVSNCVAVVAGGYHSLAIKGDGFPYILVQPFNQSVLVSRDVTFQVVASGEQPLTYQWRRDGTDIGGATSSSYTLSNVQVSDGAGYSVAVGNRYGTVLSTTALLIPITSPPVLITPPQNTTVICGDPAALQVSAAGTAPLSYQWQFQSAPIPGATQTSYSIAVATPAQAGQYSVVITNLYGSVTGSATLTVIPTPPQITSPLTASAVQGQPFSYQIHALHTPVSFGAKYLPGGLSVNPLTGLISGTPTDYGTFDAIITANNACTSDSETLVISVTGSLPVITSAASVVAGENSPLVPPYQITATGSPTNFAAQNLPVGLLVNSTNGQITGTPTYSGVFVSTISAANRWGSGSAQLQFTITNAVVGGLQINNLSHIYQTPYLLDFPFTLRDINGSQTVGNGIVTQPNLIKPTCMENYPNGTLTSVGPALPTGTDLTTNYVAETGILVAPGNGKLVKTYLVLDFSDSISDPVINGDSNGDGISDAVDNLISGSQYYVDQAPSGTQIGVYEFHRDDESPQQVIGLATKKPLLDSAIAGIWTNYVNWFYAGSRCWDAVDAAIGAMGSQNPDEQHYVIFVSDGLDYSSTVTVTQLIADANNYAVKVYCIAFGVNPDTTTLQNICQSTGGRLYNAVTPPDLYQQFALISKDIQAQYILRWATLRRDANPFLPFFLLTYQSIDVAPAPWTSMLSNNVVDVIDTNSTPPVTNSTTNYTLIWSNPNIGQYIPTNYAGPVTNGSLRLVPDAEVEPSGLTLRATYVPRYIRQIRLHYRANWPCTPILASTNSGEALAKWSMSQSNALDGSTWLTLSSTNTVDLTTSIPFAWFGPLLTFRFEDAFTNFSSAFSLIAVDNSIYTNIIAGGQTFSFVAGNTNLFVTIYPPMPHGTPVPWLISYGYTPGNSNYWATAELADPDGDGMPNWKEYWANTNPTNAASKFVVRSVVRQSNGRFAITFSTSFNRTYAVYSSTNLLNWDTVQSGIPAANQDVTIIDTRPLNNPSTLYYRAVVY